MSDPAVTSEALPTPPGVVPSTLHFPVVGIGASAGGLAALQLLFENMPSVSEMAFVVILHLSPRHPSSAAEILQRATRMPVVQVTSKIQIEPGHVYVIAPNMHLSMVDGLLLVDPQERPRGQHVAIDLFFRTLAHVHRERAVAIVLSGTGSDGAVGLSRVKEQGGLTLVQAPGDAEHDGMPCAAIRTGAVDFVLPVADMPQKLIDLWDNAKIIRLPPPDDARPRSSTRRRRPTSPSPRTPCRTSSRRCWAIPATTSATTSAPPCCAASSAACRCARCTPCPNTATCSSPTPTSTRRCSTTC